MTPEPIDLTDLDLFSSGFPHDAFRHLRAEAPVWWHPPTTHTPDAEGFWVLSRHADVHDVAADATTFSSDGSRIRASGGGGTLIEDLAGGFAAGVLLNMQDDPRHQRFRKLVTPAVAPRALALMERELRERTERIVDAAAGDGACDFVIDIAAELPLQAVARLMGVPQGDRHQLFQWANATLDHDERELGEADQKMLEANAAMFDYGTRLIEHKRSHPDDGIISAVTHARIPSDDDPAIDEPLTELELQMFFNLLIAAGSETTRNSIAGGLLGFTAFPDQWALLQRDRSLLPSAVEEILRWASSTTYNRRTATCDTEIHGQAVRAGQKVTLWWSSANYDESVFTDPFVFDVRRSPNKHLAFGHGAHFCLGANLARLEIKVMFDVLLDRFAAIQPTGPPEWTRSNKHTGLRHLPVRFVPVGA